MMHRLFLIDDHGPMRSSLARFLDGEPDISVCGQAGSAREGLSQLGTETPDLILVDVSMPEMNGIEFVRELKKTQPDLKCLMVSAHAQLDYVDEALKAGAWGYVMKEDPLDVLEAIRQVMRGEVYVGLGVE